MFRALYGLGLAPWDGHPLARSLTDLIEGGTLTPGRALDIGCGTGDTAVYLARHGWRVVGVDFVDKPLREARRKAAGLTVEFVEADVTRLRSAPIEKGFDLVVDSCTLHGMSGPDRDAYVEEVTAIAHPDARLLVMAVLPGASMGVPGISAHEVERRFAAGWELLDHGVEPSLDRKGRNAARYYLFARSDGPLSARRREMINAPTEIGTEFSEIQWRMAERVVERTKFWPEPIRKILWGQHRRP